MASALPSLPRTAQASCIEAPEHSGSCLSLALPTPTSAGPAGRQGSDRRLALALRELKRPAGVTPHSDRLMVLGIQVWRA